MVKVHNVSMTSSSRFVGLMFREGSHPVIYTLGSALSVELKILTALIQRVHVQIMNRTDGSMQECRKTNSV